MYNSNFIIDRADICELIATVHGNKLNNTPPYHLTSHLKKYNVIELQEAEIDFDGYVMSRGDYFVIGYNRSHPKHRIRFTCGHELAHIILNKNLNENKFRNNFKECSIDIWDQNKNEEILCNKMAAELLLPEAIFRKYTSRLEPSFLSLKKLSEIFFVSQEVILRQIMDLNLWDLNLVQWLPIDEEWPLGGYYVKQSWNCGNQKLLVRKNYRISALTSVHKVYTEIKYGKEAFDQGIIMESRLVESKFSKFGRHVQSILIQKNVTKYIYATKEKQHV